MKKGKIGEYFIQLIIVIIGVYVGMIASEWNTNQNLKKQRSEILVGIKNEMISNKNKLERLDSTRQKFIEHLDTVRYLVDVDVWRRSYSSDLFGSVYKYWNGLGHPHLSSSMFEVAKYGQILPALNLELVNQISYIYERQSILVDINNSYLNRFINIEPTMRMEDVHKLVWLIREDLWGAQYSLSKMYDESIEMVDRELGIVER